MTVFASSGTARTFDYQAGRFADISPNQWLALTPPELVQAHLNLDDATTTAVAAYKGTPIIVK